MKKRIIKTKRYIYLIIFLAILFFCQMLLIPFNLVLAETKKEPINNEFVEYAISAQTENVVKQIEVYLQANPDKTIKDLSQDEIFKDIVFQPVGERGYGAIADPATAYLKLHPDKAMLNKDLSFIGEKAPEWWALFNRAMKEEFCDYYIWPENDGSMSNKYLCAKFITINNKQYGFAVTAYANEFRDVIKNNDAATTYFDEYENMETKTKSEKGAEKICLTKIVYGFLGVLAVIFLMLSIFNQLGIIKIERNTFFYLLPIALLMIIGLFLFSTWRITRNMKEKISISAAESLKALVVSRTEHINTLIDGYKNTTEILAVGNPFRDVFDEKIEYKKRIQQTNRRIKAVLGADLQISRIRILNKDGGIVASSFENDTITNKDVFEKSLKETVIGEVHVSEKTKQKIINISSPITLNEEFVGVLVISYDFEKINQVSDNKFELGETGETYLVNKDGYVITSLRFKEDAFLKQKIDSVNLKNCLKHAGNTHLNHKEVISFIDYQGVKVLGAHSYIPETQWCLLAEKDDREIMASINHDIKKTWMFIFAIVGLITVVGMLFNFLLTRSLKREVDAKTINIKNQSNKIKEQLKKEELITKEKDRLLVGQKKAQIKLEEQIKEMEKFQKLTVNRELRMIELKKEIKKLESK